MCLASDADLLFGFFDLFRCAFSTEVNAPPPKGGGFD
jgi:hypothetical protein